MTVATLARGESTIFYHMVPYKLPEGASQETIDKVTDLFESLREIPALKLLVVGPIVKPPPPSDDGPPRVLPPNLVISDWTHAALMGFDSSEAMMTEFGPHPIHQQVFRDTMAEFAAFTGIDVAG